MLLKSDHLIITERSVSKQVSHMQFPEDLSQTQRNKSKMQEMF